MKSKRSNKCSAGSCKTIPKGVLDMSKISLSPTNAFCPQSLYLYGTYKKDGTPDYGLFCWATYCWDEGLRFVACIGETSSPGTGSAKPASSPPINPGSSAPKRVPCWRCRCRKAAPGRLNSRSIKPCISMIHGQARSMFAGYGTSVRTNAWRRRRALWRSVCTGGPGGQPGRSAADPDPWRCGGCFPGSVPGLGA